MVAVEALAWLKFRRFDFNTKFVRPKPKSLFGGSLYTADGSVKLSASNTLAAGVYTMLYVPNAYASGSDSVMYPRT